MVKKFDRAQAKTPSRRSILLLHSVVLLVVALAATSSMWTRPVLLAGHSARKDLARLVEFDTAVRARDFFPTWSPDLYSGYGSPLFQFYAPLSYYVTEVPVLIGFDYATALKLTQLLALFASGLAMYLLGSTYFSGWAACFGSIFYMVVPYRIVDIFVRHALAEHCAFIWLPLVVWGTARFVSNLGSIGLIIGALSTAALILTHNVMALMALPVCVGGGWALASLGDAKDRRFPNRSAAIWTSPLLAGVVALLGIGLAAFFWWPALHGRALTHAESSLTGGYYDFHRHFIQAWQLLDPRWSFGISASGAANQMPVQIGLLHLLASLGALAMVLGGWQGEGDTGRRRVTWSIVGLCMISIGAFMCCRSSQLLWESLPLVRYVQFPWRFLALVVFGSAMCATALGDRFAAVASKRSSAMMVSLMGLIVIMAAYFPYYSQSYFLVGDGRTRSLVRVSAGEVDALQSSGLLIPFGLSTPTPADLRQMHERATSSDDFLPRDVKEKPSQPPSQFVQTEGGQVVESDRLRFNHYRARVQLASPGTVKLLQFWFPGWRATVDGVRVTTAPAGSEAIVSCDAPAGDHVVEFRYYGLPERRTGITISILSVLVGVGALSFFPRRESAVCHLV